MADSHFPDPISHKTPLFPPLPIMTGAVHSMAPQVTPTPTSTPSANNVNVLPDINMQHETDNQLSTQTGHHQGTSRRSKRSLEESPSASTNAHKCKRKRKRDTGGLDGVRRVGCPYYKHDSRNPIAKSCKGQGFNETGKLKDHIKDIHGLPQQRCNTDINFKANPYVKFKDLGVKWTLAYRRLFPEVPEDKVPSPWAAEEPLRPAIYPDDLGKISKYATRLILDLVERNLSGHLPDDLENEIRKAVLAAGSLVNEEAALASSSTSNDATGARGYSSSTSEAVELAPFYSHENLPINTKDEGYCGSSPAMSNKSFPGAMVTPNLAMALEPDFHMDTKPVLVEGGMRSGFASPPIPATLYPALGQENFPPNHSVISGTPKHVHGYPSPAPDCNFDDFSLFDGISAYLEDPTYALDEADMRYNIDDWVN
ncbi:hypothetical protein Ptr902_12718 [Pyrenophora tritici-repentis]|nr:hypothetical protein Ptr902_12718 [Pyrenophora tritici-repentis]